MSDRVNPRTIPRDRLLRDPLALSAIRGAAVQRDTLRAVRSERTRDRLCRRDVLIARGIIIPKGE